MNMGIANAASRNIPSMRELSVKLFITILPAISGFA